jgi:hypothetical protein
MRAVGDNVAAWEHFLGYPHSSSAVDGVGGNLFAVHATHFVNEWREPPLVESDTLKAMFTSNLKRRNGSMVVGLRLENLGCWEMLL